MIEDIEDIDTIIMWLSSSEASTSLYVLFRWIVPGSEQTSMIVESGDVSCLATLD